MKKVDYGKDKVDKLRDYNPYIVLDNLGLTVAKNAHDY